MFPPMSNFFPTSFSHHLFQYLFFSLFFPVFPCFVVPWISLKPTPKALCLGFGHQVVALRWGGGGALLVHRRHHGAHGHGSHHALSIAHIWHAHSWPLERLERMACFWQKTSQMGKKTNHVWRVLRDVLCVFLFGSNIFLRSLHEGWWIHLHGSHLEGHLPHGSWRHVGTHGPTWKQVADATSFEMSGSGLSQRQEIENLRQNHHFSDVGWLWDDSWFWLISTCFFVGHLSTWPHLPCGHSQKLPGYRQVIPSLIQKSIWQNTTTALPSFFQEKHRKTFGFSLSSWMSIGSNSRNRNLSDRACGGACGRASSAGAGSWAYTRWRILQKDWCEIGRSFMENRTCVTKYKGLMIGHSTLGFLHPAYKLVQYLSLQECVQEISFRPRAILKDIEKHSTSSALNDSSGSFQQDENTIKIMNNQFMQNSS